MELCNVDPDDPIEYIATYLEAKALQGSAAASTGS